MSCYDRYVLSQLLRLFGFFALVLIAVIWINRAVVLFDRLISDGQSAMVFLEFTALGLPRLVQLVLPMAIFAASVFVTNRMNGDSELTVMQATGSSPWRLSRPVVIFGVLVGLMMAALTHYLLPASTAQLAEREHEVSRNATARLLSEGTFLHPVDGVTLFIREIARDGTLRDVFLSDRRRSDVAVTFTANRAFLVRREGRAQIIMLEGLAQRITAADQRMSTTTFADFSYDISDLVAGKDQARASVRALSTHALLYARTRLAAQHGYDFGRLTEELHLRFAYPLTCIAVAMIGFAALMLGEFSRIGIWPRIIFAFVLLLTLELMRVSVAPLVLADAERWWLLYLPATAGMGFSAFLLYLSSGRYRRTRARPAQEARA